MGGDELVDPVGGVVVGDVPVDELVELLDDGDELLIGSVVDVVPVDDDDGALVPSVLVEPVPVLLGSVADDELVLSPVLWRLWWLLVSLCATAALDKPMAAIAKIRGVRIFLLHLGARYLRSRR